MINLAPWYYRKLLGENNLIESPHFYKITLLNGIDQFEAVTSVKPNLRPSWVTNSEIYKNCDGSGTSSYKNIAVYKAISEALERLAFYELAEVKEKEYRFDVNPTTTGMAAYPSFSCKIARENAINEAVERWAIHEFNKGYLPVHIHNKTIDNLIQYELITPFPKTKVTLLEYKYDGFYIYSFAGGTNIKHSFERALIELSRNIRVLTKVYKNNKSDNYNSPNDKTIYFFSTNEGNQKFNHLIESSSKKIVNRNPKIICDKEMKGSWSEYTKVWRYLLEDSYYDASKDHAFFMF